VLHNIVRESILMFVVTCPHSLYPALWEFRSDPCSPSRRQRRTGLGVFRGGPFATWA
jgi:hypothetical protein